MIKSQVVGVGVPARLRFRACEFRLQEPSANGCTPSARLTFTLRAWRMGNASCLRSGAKDH